MAKVVLSGVCKSYGAVQAVRDVNLEIDDGELLVLVGPSGCGKSTTLRMVAGLEEITSGTLSIGDRVVNSVHPKDRDIAMVFQSYALYPHMTVFDNMAFGLRLRGLPAARIDELVRSAAATLGLEEFLDRKPKALSGGQRQRVAMGRAIVREPAVFLFDEPLSNLDAKFRVAMRLELKMLQRKLGTTTLYVTHDQTEAMTLADRIAVMADGRIRQVGRPQEVFETPADRFVAGFIGSPEMNFLAGVVVMEGDDAVIRTKAMDLRPADAPGKALGRLSGREITVGVRPGAVAPADQTDGINRFRGRVQVVEHLGTAKYAYVQTDAGVLTISVAPDVPVEEGASMTFSVQADKLHLFDEDDQRITGG
ncbi:MAG: sn-glycerol-3-phosphate ABC transporter ATP-binding protein UgpC [Deltaproteobacteria bacterium]|nr:sn-glycerol-3-phosphate ABC transporter ATP-binding protein UgpC [Deltaproteobacteria bacterium]